jgi:hypothetical protein
VSTRPTGRVNLRRGVTDGSGRGRSRGDADSAVTQIASDAVANYRPTRCDQGAGADGESGARPTVRAAWGLLIATARTQALD